MERDGKFGHGEKLPRILQVTETLHSEIFIQTYTEGSWGLAR